MILNNTKVLSEAEIDIVKEIGSPIVRKKFSILND